MSKRFTLRRRFQVVSPFLYLQPKSGFLPEAGRGGTEYLGLVPGRGERRGASSAKATFKAEPVS